MKEKLISEIRGYVPVNEQEQSDRELILKLLETHEDLTLRSSLQAHLTASGEQIQHGSAFNVELQHGENRFLDTVGGGAGVFALESIQLCTSGGTGNDSHGKILSLAG